MPMVSAADVFCLAIFIGMVALEGNRGIIPALVDFVCVLVGLIGVRTALLPLSQHLQPSNAYLLLVGLLVVITALISIYVSRRLRIHVTAWESAVGVLFGLCTAALLSFTFFEWLAIRYGSSAHIIRDSILSWVLLEWTGFEEFTKFLHTLMGR